MPRFTMRNAGVGFSIAWVAFVITVGSVIWLSLGFLTPDLMQHEYFLPIGIVGASVGAIVFVMTYLHLARPNDACTACWEALSQTIFEFQQALRNRDAERGHELYERGWGAVQLAIADKEAVAEQNCVALLKVLERLEQTPQASPDQWRKDASHRLGVLLSLSPYSVPPVSQAIWMQALWQVLAILLSMAALIAAWRGTTVVTLKALVYAGGGGTMGVSLYNLRTLVDYITTRRNYSTRFWVDYLTRPLLGAVLSVIVYAFITGLAWSVTLPGGSAGGSAPSVVPKAVFGLGFLSGYALRSVLTWLGEIAKSVFRPAPSPSKPEETSPSASN